MLVRGESTEECVYYGERKIVEVTDPKYFIYERFERGVPRRVRSGLAKLLQKKPQWVVGDRYPLAQLIGDSREPIRILIRRFGALGDLIMLRAVVHSFTKLFPWVSFGLRCEDRHLAIFKNDPLWIEKLGYSDNCEIEYSGTIILDGIAEVDHSRRAEEQVHRVDLFTRFLLKGVDMIGKKLDITWHLPIGYEDRTWVQKWMISQKIARHQLDGSPLIALQMRGSGEMKSLPESHVRELALNLAEYGHVVLLDPDNYYEDLLQKSNKIHQPQTDVLKIASILEYVDCCVTMDSGILWICHCTKTPVVCLLGPTRPSERITLHPLYKDGLARTIELNEIIHCPPCFETANRCSWRYDCLRQGLASWKDLLFDHVEDICARRLESRSTRPVREVPKDISLPRM